MTNPVSRLLSILDLNKKDHNLFCGESGSSLWQRVFGGHVIAQALVAAQKTIEGERFVHSLHAYFMRPGNPEIPIFYEVERLRDGGSFSTRRVVAKQEGTAIFSFSASFQIDEQGLEYQRPMPQNLPQPEDLIGDDALNDAVFSNAPEIFQNYWNLNRPFLIRPIDLENYIERNNAQPFQRCWFKLDGQFQENRAINAAMLAYLSDMTLLDTSLLVHERSIFSPDIQVASLDHSMWFHRPFKLDDWLLYDLESPNSCNSRGLSRGFIYTRDGTLVASVAQEGLMRLVRPKV